MKRCRRPLILIALLLPGGAVVNVAVAWGRVLREHASSMSLPCNEIAAYVLRLAVGLGFLLPGCTSTAPLPNREPALHGVRASATQSGGRPRIEFEFEPPSSWRRHAVRFRPLTPDLYADAERVVSSALRKYPRQVQARLERVVVLSTLAFNQTQVGGSYYEATIVLASESPASTSHLLERLFHHEFASVLWRQDVPRFDVAEWRALNPVGFEYGGSGLAALRESASWRPPREWYPQGFLEEYATSTFSNDFSSIAEGLFMGELALWNPAFHRLCKKRDLAIAFYQSLDQQLSPAYFYQFYVDHMARLGLDPYPLAN